VIAGGEPSRDALSALDHAVWLAGRLLWLATVVWTATHPTVGGYVVAAVGTGVLAWYDRQRSDGATAVADGR
jgi:hypothetical protein